MLIRSARPQDAAAIEAVRIAGWQAAYVDILPADFLAGVQVDPVRVRWREAMLAEPAAGDVTLVAEHESAVCGAAALLRIAPDTAELRMLYVAPERWQTGIGHTLLVEGFARTAEPVQVLWVLAGNLRARRFYERHGFATDGGRQVQDLGGPAVEVRYRRVRQPTAT